MNQFAMTECHQFLSPCSSPLDLRCSRTILGVFAVSFSRRFFLLMGCHGVLYERKYLLYYSIWFSVILMSLQKRNTNKSYLKLLHSLLNTRNLGRRVGRMKIFPSSLWSYIQQNITKRWSQSSPLNFLLTGYNIWLNTYMWDAKEKKLFCFAMFL